MEFKKAVIYMDKHVSSILDEMAKTIPFDVELIDYAYDVVSAVFSLAPRANIAIGVRRKLKDINGTIRSLAGMCCVSEQTLHNWLKPHGEPGAVDIDAGRLCILIIGLSALNGGEDIASCAGSVAALCDRGTLMGGEDAVRKRLVTSILGTVENKLRYADMEELLALAAVLRSREETLIRGV